jgi:hypothetical protein
MIALILLIPALSFSMTLKTEMKTVELEQYQDYWISKNCDKCLAKKTLTELGAKQVQKALEKKSKGSIAPGVLLCDGLEGLTFIMKDDAQLEVSVCEFKDKSYTKIDDLASLLHKLKIHRK